MIGSSCSRGTPAFAKNVVGHAVFKVGASRGYGRAKKGCVCAGSYLRDLLDMVLDAQRDPLRYVPFAAEPARRHLTPAQHHQRPPPHSHQLLLLLGGQHI